MNPKKNKNQQETKEFWEYVEATSSTVQGWPEWKKWNWDVTTEEPTELEYDCSAEKAENT
jgi:hypothetical protein